LEALSKWNKKKLQGYHEIGDEHPQIARPMLAMNFLQRSHDIQYPCFVQPKLDGVRCLYVNGRLYSRNQKEFTCLHHIRNELVEKIDAGVILDGELYGIDFQQLVGLVRKKTLTDDELQCILDVKFFVFDMVSDTDFLHRNLYLEDLFSVKSFNHCIYVSTKSCASKEQVFTFLDTWSNYEGIMVRNQRGIYHSNFRSPDLQKLKKSLDKEFIITGFTAGSGNEQGCVIWVCKTDCAKSFSVRPKGDFATRRKLFLEADQYIGKLLTVQYQELTEDGIPRFPVGVVIRDYE
jgi:ATP-dependent DNA ligase